MARAVYMSSSDQQEVITLNISTDSDVNRAIADVKEIPGVLSVESGKITVKTTHISSDWKSSLESRMTTAVNNITSGKIVSNETIMVELEPGSDPTAVIKKLKNLSLIHI